MTDPFDLVGKGRAAALQALLQADPALASARHDSGASLLAFAAYMQDAEATAVIRAARDGINPWEACILGDIEVLEAALAGGWSPDGLAPDGFPPLALTAFFRNAAAFDLLLPRVTDVDRRAENPQRVAALHAATAARQVEMVEKLLRAGADPNLTQAGGFTPLHAAAQHGDATIAGLLLLFGADPHQPDAEGRTAADHAGAAGHDWLVRLLPPDRPQATEM